MFIIFISNSLQVYWVVRVTYKASQAAMIELGMSWVRHPALPQRSC